MRWLRSAVEAVAGLVAVYGLAVAAVGLPRQRVPADGSEAQAETYLSGPTPVALVFVIAAAVVIVGVHQRRWGWAWAGWAAMAAFAVLSGFSVGLFVLPVVPLLLIGLAVLWRAARSDRAYSRASSGTMR